MLSTVLELNLREHSIWPPVKHIQPFREPERTFGRSIHLRQLLYVQSVEPKILMAQFSAIAVAPGLHQLKNRLEPLKECNKTEAKQFRLT